MEIRKTSTRGVFDLTPQNEIDEAIIRKYDLPRDCFNENSYWATDYQKDRILQETEVQIWD